MSRDEMTKSQLAVVQALFTVGVLLLLSGIGVFALVSMLLGVTMVVVGAVTMVGTVVAWSALEPPKTAEEAAQSAAMTKRGWRPFWIGLAVLFVIVMGGGAIQVMLS
ncbi:hypothetical protein ACFWVM_04020 [Nocardia fluminea]|uniref:hypothetical protein n=1 Tax=Nocardia fluminea TaxID=134984 RepID=UPI003668363F